MTGTRGTLNTMFYTQKILSPILDFGTILWINLGRVVVLEEFLIIHFEKSFAVLCLLICYYYNANFSIELRASFSQQQWIMANSNSTRFLIMLEIVWFIFCTWCNYMTFLKGSCGEWYCVISISTFKSYLAISSRIFYSKK